MKLCVLFPGIGYHCGRPLLHLSERAAAERGYTVVCLAYSDFPEDAKGSEEKMRAAADHALLQSEQQLSKTDFSQYERVVFIGKSIGTAACLAYREKFGIKAKCVLLTPLEMTFGYPTHDCVAFHGTADPWAKTQDIERLCAENDVKLYEYPYANHSLVTADTDRNEAIAEDVVSKIGELIG